MTKSILLAGVAFMALAVILGAFGAHALKSRLSPDMITVYKTGVEYHFYHALGLLIIGVISIYIPGSLTNWSAVLIGAGIIIFSGSLYVLAVSGVRWLGAITPIGGLSFIIGWVLLFISIWKTLPTKL